MHPSLRLGTGGVAVLALAGALTFVPGAAAAAVPCSVGDASPSPTPSGARPSSTARPTAEPTATGSIPAPSVPSEADVAEAREAAEAAAQEVAEITAKVEAAEERLQTLQCGLADAVASQERAELQLTEAEAAVQQATGDLAAARRAREDADRDLSGTAALMYMQGGDLQNLTTLVLSPPTVMSDLAVVLDQDAHEVRRNLDAATAAALDAASRERLLVIARDHRSVAVEEAAAKRTAAETKAAEAGAEAARLGKQQEVLTARLDELLSRAADVAALREAAARLGSTALLGLQAAGGSEPRAAQEIARAKMASYGWDAAEFTCLVALWNAESGWSWSATNPSSGAYGIPQALPGWKMASAGSDWLTNPATQITWGMGYIESVYGSPCAAYDQWLARSPHWY